MITEPKTVKRCSCCVLPETTPNIIFDKDNVCNFCHSHEKIQYESESKLRGLLDSYRKDGNKYDCITGISGGRDSSYLLLKLVKDYKLNVLAVNYENPFTDPQAKINIENAVKTLNIDLVSFKLKNGVHEKTFKHNFIQWIRKPSPAAVPMLCIGCKTFIPHIIKYAKKYNIRCVVNGGNPYEDTSFKKELLNFSATESYKNNFTSSLGGILNEMLKNPFYCHPKCIPTMITGFLYGDQYAFGPRIFASNIKFIDMFHYIPWREEEVLSRIKSELGWISPTKFKSSWRFDCRIGHLKDFLYMETLNMTEKDDFYSKLVREGLITRDKALKKLFDENIMYADEICELIESNGISIKNLYINNENGTIIRKLQELQHQESIRF